MGSSIKVSTIKRLFAVCSNQCAFPGCKTPIVEPSGTVTGEIAHIRAANKNGPRYDVSQTDEERSSYANLILICSRHHTIIDTEVSEFPIELLTDYKRAQEQQGAVEITPQTTAVSKVLLKNYQNIVVSGNTGKVAINSPGAIQADTINIKSSRAKTILKSPDGSVSAVLEMNSYIEYLIGKYKDFQLQDSSKQDNYKYMIIYNAIKREFGSKWQLVPASNFEKLVLFLHKRIDNSRVGRIRLKRGQKSYHSYSEHIELINKN